MNVVKTLLREERKLLAVSEKTEVGLKRIRAAIHALTGNGTGARVGRPAGRHALKGRKLSAAHKRAIREGIAKAKKEG